MGDKFPKNCTECPHSKTCNNACFGSLGCKYEKEIREAILKREKR